MARRAHCSHDKEEAIEETLLIQVYKEFFEEYLTIPVIAGEKTESEKFPGADATYTIEAIMQDGKALQPSHFLGENFSKAQNIKYLADDKTEKHCWTTSWGVSTRMIGGLIMSHSDDDGLVLPPKIASAHIRILPIFRREEEKELVENFVADLVQKLKGQTFSSIEISVDVDNRDVRGGEKYWSNVKKVTTYS